MLLISSHSETAVVTLRKPAHWNARIAEGIVSTEIGLMNKYLDSTARSRSTSPSNAPMSAARKTMQNQFVVSPQVAISAFNRRITQFVRGLADDMVLDAVAESAAAEVTLGAFDFGL
eukprot:TRINITY_DN28364_c0_g5_i2.p2 TRINITY_DN28364_c0_g5~~TRINITY_DN28364_c0_g5_i2.p2  ORF type:complete len:117 (-),score=11.54 TRINITY_DN28364_c0_g5_i2:113-463(-)